MTTSSLRLSFWTSAVLLLAISFTHPSFAQQSKGRFIALQPHYRDAEARLVSSFATIPNFTAPYSFLGQNFIYTLVGTDPSQGSATTTIPVFLVPVKLTFADGTIRSPKVNIPGTTTTALSLTLASPIFKPLDWQSGGVDLGVTQYIDAYQRGSLWNTVSRVAPNYHVLLSKPVLMPTLGINVPADEGVSSANPISIFVTVGLADVDFMTARFQNYIDVHSQIVPNSLVIFLTYQTYLTQLGSCCIGGFHTATGNSTAPQTYMHASFVTGFPAFSEDIASLSHEVGEWMADPFVDNVTPCNAAGGVLEVGDPLSGVDFPVAVGGFTYHPQDLTFLSYFTGDFPSKAVNRQFTFKSAFHFPCSLM